MNGFTSFGYDWCSCGSPACTQCIFENPNESVLGIRIQSVSDPTCGRCIVSVYACDVPAGIRSGSDGGEFGNGGKSLTASTEIYTACFAKQQCFAD